MGRRELAVDILAPLVLVGVFGLVLVFMTGVWPPLVAVESGSMEPNAARGDLVVVSEVSRFSGPGADPTGLVTAERAERDGGSYSRLGESGDVIVFSPPGRTNSPIFHRVAFAVEEGEDWYSRADSRYHGAADCAELMHCPAPHDGYITRGDDNTRYDQAEDIAPPVEAEWIAAKGQVRIPNVGWLRLIFEE